MESLQTPERTQTPPIEREGQDKRQRTLVLCAAVIGVAFDRLIATGLWASENHIRLTLVYGGFWMLYLALFAALSWKRLLGARSARLFGIAAVLLVARGFLYAQQELLAMNLVVLPFVLMLHAALVRYGDCRGREGRLVAAYVAGWFVWPFSGMGRFFAATGSLFCKRGAKTANQALLGVLIALPALVLAGVLLLRADAVFSGMMEELLLRFDLFGLCFHLFAALLAALLFGSFFYHAAIASDERPAMEKERAKLPSVTLFVALSLVLALYAVFAYIQFAYLTGLNGLPAGLTYAQYARGGFGELLWVLVINLGLFALSLAWGEKSRALTALLCGLLAASAVMLGSALARLLLYVGAYGLTAARVLSLWMIAFFAFALIACAVKLARGATPLLRLLAAALMAWYLALNFVNIDGMIAQSVLSRAARAGELSFEDASYVHSLSSDANPVRERYRELLDRGGAPDQNT